MTTEPYRVSRYTHSRRFPWQWRCLHGDCPEGGIARSEDQATAKATAHAQTHEDPS